MEDILTMIANFGFPIVVSAYLLVRIEGNGPSADAAGAVPIPELMKRAYRRRFSSAYKLRILREADGLSRPGEIGALLRREGLYSSHLSVWRRQRDEGTREALSRPRGRKPADPPSSRRWRSCAGGSPAPSRSLPWPVG